MTSLDTGLQKPDTGLKGRPYLCQNCRFGCEHFVTGISAFWTIRGWTYFVSVGLFIFSHRPVWSQATEHGQLALDSCERTARHAVRCTHVRESVRRHGAVNAHHRVERAADLLIIAHKHLSEAIDDLNAAVILLEMKPDDFAGAPAALTRLSQRILGASLLLAAIAERLTEASNEVLELAENGVGPEPKVEPPSRPMPPRRTLVYRPASVAERIEALLKRRQRSTTVAPEDVPRKLSRGRAPPPLSACSL